MTINARKPTGVVPWPLILIEGGEKVGKSFAAAEFSASGKVGQTYWLDLGEGAADEYGAIPGARYLVVEHDGEWRNILCQVMEIKAEAQRAADAGEPPVVLVIDSMSNEWGMLSDWASQRAKRSNANKAKVAKDPDAEVSISMNLWNDATSRHRKLMTTLLTFPGVVIMTARGKEVAALDDNGKPSGDKAYKVEGHKTLAYDASVWVRLCRDTPPMVVGARSVRHGIRPGVDKPKPAPQFTVEWLVFDVLGCDPGTATVRDIKPLAGGELSAEERGVDGLADVKAKVWAAATELGWDVRKLGEDYAKCHNNAPIQDATVDELGEYLIELLREVEVRRQQPVADAA